MKKTQPDVNSVWFLCLAIALICSLASCAEVPAYYWAKSGVSQEQIRKDNMFCADMAAQKPSIYPRTGEWFYFAPLDQPSYRNCMTSQGYRMVSKEDLQRGVHVVIPDHPVVQMQATRKLCERVAGEVGDVNSCIRWMSFNPNTSMPPANTSAWHDSPKQESSTTSSFTETEEMRVCLRQDPNGEKRLIQTVIESCNSTRSESQ